MTSVQRVREYRFVVPGEAVSFRVSRATLYKERVRHCARRTFRRQPLHLPVQVRLDYFHASHRRCDMDNVSKCVLDALNGIAYVDDQQVELQSATSHDLTKRVILRGGPVDLVKPLAKHLNYLLVRIRLTRSSRAA